MWRLKQRGILKSEFYSGTNPGEPEWGRRETAKPDGNQWDVKDTLAPDWWQLWRDTASHSAGPLGLLLTGHMEKSPWSDPGMQESAWLPLIPFPSIRVCSRGVLTSSHLQVASGGTCCGCQGVWFWWLDGQGEGLVLLATWALGLTWGKEAIWRGRWHLCLIQQNGILLSTVLGLSYWNLIEVSIINLNLEIGALK